ncbi:MAG: FAD-dependent oxidoreductase, partial [Cyanobacteria bacterium]|nr:FAD-dependent oxidoreductase [Cyanobacteriota bacterium]
MEDTIKKIKKTDEIADYLIIGNSAAGLSAVSAIRTIDKTGSILVLTNEQYKNYSKPLITYLLAGKIGLDNIYFKDDKFYEENNILLKSEINVKKINFKDKMVISDKGISFKYNKLLLANGGSPIIPKIRIVEADDFIEFFFS